MHTPPAPVIKINAAQTSTPCQLKKNGAPSAMTCTSPIQITTGQSSPRCHSSAVPPPPSGSSTAAATAAVEAGRSDSRTTSGRCPRPFQESTFDDLRSFKTVAFEVNNPTLSTLLIFSGPVLCCRRCRNRADQPDG